jgi:hypothetical protein
MTITIAIQFAQSTTKNASMLSGKIDDLLASGLKSFSEDWSIKDIDKQNV